MSHVPDFKPFASQRMVWEKDNARYACSSSNLGAKQGIQTQCHIVVEQMIAIKKESTDKVGDGS